MKKRNKMYRFFPDEEVAKAAETLGRGFKLLLLDEMITRYRDANIKDDSNEMFRCSLGFKLAVFLFHKGLLKKLSYLCFYFDTESFLRESKAFQYKKNGRWNRDEFFDYILSINPHFKSLALHTSLIINKFEADQNRIIAEFVKRHEVINRPGRSQKKGTTVGAINYRGLQ